LCFGTSATGYARGYLHKDLEDKIKKALRDKTSPRHVPVFILQVPEIPYTLNMKKVESSVTNIVNGRPVTNRDALKNPECLEYYEQMLPELEK
jgi:acetoacetyl-CoA synthetase